MLPRTRLLLISVEMGLAFSPGNDFFSVYECACLHTIPRLFWPHFFAIIPTKFLFSYGVSEHTCCGWSLVSCEQHSEETL